MGMRFYLVAAALAATTWSEGGVEDLQGVLLDGFELLQARPGSQVALVEQEAELDAERGHGNYPLQQEYPGATYLRSGSFGEAWDAVETIRGVATRVVLKIFYRKDAYGRITYLQSGMLLPEETEAVKEATAECHLARNMITQAPAGDVGAQRIVNCIHDRVTGRARSQALYLVLEHGGTSLEQWIASPQGARASLEERRKIVGQLLQGIRTMGELEPTVLVHHDLKPGNAVYDGKTAKLIDFGGTMLGVQANMLKPAVATPGYAPPEFLQGTAAFRYRKVSFGMPATSYDMFAMGMIYAEVMCAGSGLTLRNLVGFARSQFKRTQDLKQLLRNCPVQVPLEDLSMMKAMMAYEHSKRPYASTCLLSEPFASIAEFNTLDGGSVPSHSSAGSDILAESIVPKNWNNPNVRGGRGGLYDPNVAVAAQQWQGATQCASKISQPIMVTAQFASMTGTKAQCETACVTYSNAQKRLLLMAYPGAHNFCCQMDVFRDAYGVQGRNCYVGGANSVDELIPAIDNSYAVVLRMPESADDAAPHLDVAAGPPAVGQKWHTPGVVRVWGRPSGDVNAFGRPQPVVGNVFGRGGPSGPSGVVHRPSPNFRDVADPPGRVVYRPDRDALAAQRAGWAAAPHNQQPARFIRPDQLAGGGNGDPQERRPPSFYRPDVRAPVDPAGVAPFQRLPHNARQVGRLGAPVLDGRGAVVRRGVSNGVPPPGGVEARMAAYDHERQRGGLAGGRGPALPRHDEWLDRL